MPRSFQSARPPDPEGLVGIVVVSHSRKLAEGVVELAREMAGPDVRLAAAGGLGADEGALGTDLGRIQAAIAEVYAPAGVVVLLDVGSAILSAEMALEAGPPEWRGRVVLCAAPLVEGAIVAAVQARLGAPLDRVVAEARRALDPKIAQLADDAPEEEAAGLVAPPGPSSPPARDVAAGPATGVAAGPGHPAAIRPSSTRTFRFMVGDRHGLHARPAARLVETAGRFQADLQARDLTTGIGPVNARSLVGLSSLGALAGHVVEVSAAGPDTDAAIEAIASLVQSGLSGASDSVRACPTSAPAPSSDEIAPVVGGYSGADSLPLEGAGNAPSAPLRGLPASPGVAQGVARRLRRVARMVESTEGPPEREWRGLEEGRARARGEIEGLRDRLLARGERDAAEVIAIQVQYLDDPAILDRARRRIFAGMGAMAAWSAAIAETTETYHALDDTYLRARAEDLADVGRRVLRALATADGSHSASSTPSGGEPHVLLVEDLGPSDVATLDRSAVRAICAARGGPTCHAAILARGMGIPAVVGLGDAILGVPDDTPLLVDGGAGLVRVDPEVGVRRDGETQGRGGARTADVEMAGPEDAEVRGRGDEETGADDGASRTPSSGVQRDENDRGTAAKAVSLAAAPPRPGGTPSRRPAAVLANVGSVEEAWGARAAGAEGVGLLRTEFLFLGRSRAPTEDEQYDLYRAVAAALDGRPVTIRTLDIGGDKPLPYLDLGREENPALGVRAIRASLARPNLFTPQLRAIVRVAAEYPVRVMFPLVTALDEWRRARRWLDEAVRDVHRRGIRAPDTVPAGVMVETPAAALIADQFATEVNFFSLGTNDLTQYTLAADRGNPAVAALADPLHPAVLRLIRLVVEAARPRGLPVTICGEVAADLSAVPILLDLGVDALSVQPRAIPAVRAAMGG